MGHRLKINVPLIRDERPLWIAHKQISACRTGIWPHHGVDIIDLSLRALFGSQQRSTARDRRRSCRIEEVTTKAHDHRLTLNTTRIDSIHLSHDGEGLLDL